MTEQDQVPDRPGDVLDLRQHHAAGDGAERIVVKLDIAADIRIDAGGQIVQGLACQRHVAAAHVEHDVAADGGEADHRERGACDQQSC